MVTNAGATPPDVPVYAVERQPAHQIVAEISRRLADARVPSPAVDARWLVEAFCGVDVHRSPDTPVPSRAGDAHRLAAAVERRCNREPLQLIVGRAAFLDFEVTCWPGVFIPRPETEVLANLAIDALRERAQPRVIELCTGSGVIACAIARHVEHAELIAVDVDDRAVAAARANLEAIAVDARATVLHGDLFAAVGTSTSAHWRGTVDMVVANPPYLPAADAVDWQPEVADFDPPHALVGGPDGLEIVRRVLHDARGWLSSWGIILIEIDARRTDEALHAARELGWSDVEAVADLAGQPRFVRARNTAR